jgi:hypothetical protein
MPMGSCRGGCGLWLCWSTCTGGSGHSGTAVLAATCTVIGIWGSSFAARRCWLGFGGSDQGSLNLTLYPTIYTFIYYHILLLLYYTISSCIVYSIFNIVYSIFNIGYSIFNIGYSIFNIGYSIFNIGYSI